MKQLRYLAVALMFLIPGLANAQLVKIISDPSALKQWGSQLLAMAEQYAQSAYEHTQHDATIEMAAAKRAGADRAVSEGVASWQAKEGLRQENVRINHALTQSATTCGAVQTAGAAPTMDVTANTASHTSVASHALGTRTLATSATSGGTTMTVPAIHNNSNSTQQVVKAFDYVHSNFCTPDESSSGRCAGVTATNVQYPGGDVRGDLLFGDGQGPKGDGNGSLTISSDQNVAVEAFINNIVDSASPEMLRNPAWEQSDAGRKYVLMVRQYAAYMSLVSNSLHAIQANHTLQPNS